MADEQDGTDVIEFMRNELPGLLADELERRERERLEAATERYLEEFKRQTQEVDYGIKYFGPPEGFWARFKETFIRGE